MTFALVVVGLLVLSAVFSGSETGVYSMSRVRLRSEAEQGRWSARVVRRLTGNETGLLVTLLVANNLVLEVLAHRTDHFLQHAVDWPGWGVDLAATAVLTPLVFFFGELLPKDLFRRRPLQCLAFVAPLLALARVVFLVLAWPLEQFSRFAAWVVGKGRTPLERGGREEALEILQEGTRTGALSPEVEGLALNALRLRETTVTDVMVRWNDVATLDGTLPEELRRTALVDARFSRLPVTGEGGRVEGYVHQLEAFARPEGLPEVRKAHFFEPDLAVDRALARLRRYGERLAVVGTAEQPAGLVSLTNLVEAIASDLAPEARRRRAR